MPRQTNFAVEPPEPKPDRLAESYQAVDANVKEGDPLERMIADAKREGIDPETGKTDLDEEIEALRGQGELVNGDGQIDPLLAREGEWRNAEIVAELEDGTKTKVNAGDAVDFLVKRMASLRQLLDCVNAA